MHEVFNYFLRTEIISYHDPNSLKLSTDPILSSAATLDIGPGAKALGLHRDDFIWQQTHTMPREKYTAGSDVSMGLLVPGVITTAENGATLAKLSATKISKQNEPSTNPIQFIPGSHLWDDSKLPKEEGVAFAEMSVGEALLFLRSTAHAGGTNTTSQSRPMPPISVIAWRCTPFTLLNHCRSDILLSTKRRLQLLSTEPREHFVLQ